MYSVFYLLLEKNMTERNTNFENLGLPKDSERALRAIAGLVDDNSNITVEGTPIYCDKDWDDESHEFGTNVLVSAIKGVLESGSRKVIHHAMVDDFTTGVSIDGSNFTGRMQYPPENVRYESEFEQEAEETLQKLNSQGKTVRVGGETLLNSGSMPRLRVKSGRVSCELLDACFQNQKEGDVHVIVHPTEFVKQQDGMKDVLKATNGGKLPGKFINIFFKNRNLSRVIETDENGKTKRINF